MLRKSRQILEGDPTTIEKAGHELASNLNDFLQEEFRKRFRVESFLDIEFEKTFLRFFMPTIRGRDAGSKKRYAGLLTGKKGNLELYFAGLESSRRDWTALTKEFQADLFTLIFAKYDDSDLKEGLTELVKNRHAQLYAGGLDRKLIGTDIVKIKTRPPLDIPDTHFRDRIIENSRNKYCKPTHEVRKWIRHAGDRWLEPYAPLNPTNSESSVTDNEDFGYDEF